MFFRDEVREESEVADSVFGVEGDLLLLESVLKVDYQLFFFVVSKHQVDPSLLGQLDLVVGSHNLEICITRSTRRSTIGVLIERDEH